MKTIDITGIKYHDLEVIRLTTEKKNNCPLWLCKCICGKEKMATSYEIRSGHIKSCGCRKKGNRFKNANYSKGNKSPYWKGYGEISGAFWNTLKLNAKRTQS